MAPFDPRKNVVCGRSATSLRRADPAIHACFRCSCVFLDRVPQPDVRVLADVGLHADARNKTIGADNRLHFVPDRSDTERRAAFRIPLPRALCGLLVVTPNLIAVTPEEWEGAQAVCLSCVRKAGSL